MVLGYSTILEELKELLGLFFPIKAHQKMGYLNTQINLERVILPASELRYNCVDMFSNHIIVQRLYTASTFRMLMNGHFDRKWFDKFVKSGSKEYDDLPLIDKLAVYKEYMGFFQQEEFRAICNKRPYMGLQKKIMKYYREKAIADIDGLLAAVEPYDRFKYMNLMTMKLGILKLIEGKSHIDKSKGIYVDLYKELYDAGLHLDAVHVLMTLVDECSSAYNVLIWRPFWPGALYYSDIIERSVQPPDPLP